KRDRKAARAHGLAVDVQRARAALRDTTAELRAREAERVADDPEQRRLRVDVDLMLHSVDVQDQCHRLPQAARSQWSITGTDRCATPNGTVRLRRHRKVSGCRRSGAGASLRT